MSGGCSILLPIVLHLFRVLFMTNRINNSLFNCGKSNGVICVCVSDSCVSDDLCVSDDDLCVSDDDLCVSDLYVNDCGGGDGRGGGEGGGRGG